MNGTRRWPRGATIGLSLIGAGVVIGVVFLALAVPSGGPLHPGGVGPAQLTPTALGQRIYTNGRDENGRVIPRSALMMFAGATCADCHGSDARGRTVNTMMGSFEAPDIRWSTLSQPMKGDNGAMEPAYDAASFGRALTQGLDTLGEALNPPMPRWQLTNVQVDALIAFLKTK
ncbi:MAG: cytochrome c [Actinobacteria bacterium]|nr:cytochrome c [Actinomycetota bacterium]